MKNFLVFTFCLLATFSFSQNHHLKKADRLFNSLSYDNAIKQYKKYIKKSGDSTVYNKLAYSFYKKGDYDQAYTSYQAYEFTENSNPDSLSSEELYQYAISALSSDNKPHYDSLISIFSKRYPSDSRSVFHLRRTFTEKYSSTFNTKYTLSPSSINSKFSDFGYYVQNDVAFFVSNRYRNKKDKWSGKNFSSLFSFNPNDTSTKANAVKFNVSRDVKAHQSTSALNKEGTILYTTQSVRNPEGDYYLQIFRYLLDPNGQWSKPESLSINAFNFNTGHPSIDEQQSLLYFSSDRPGGYGLSDLYSVEIKPNGDLGEPVNLGPKINTPSRETFPFIDDANILYFASDGHPTFGGLDIFGIAVNDPNAMAFNLGKPLNDIKDDFAYFSYNGKTFISSNREQGEGSDDIYEVSIENPIVFNCFGSISGLVMNEQTGKPISGAEVKVLKGSVEVKSSQSSSNGFYHIENLDCGGQFTLLVSHDDLEEISKEIQISNVYDHNEISTINLGTKQTIEGQLASILETTKSNGQEILYGFDKKEYLPQGEDVIRELAGLLNENPSQKIVIESYTDPSGPEAYNKWLSQERSDFIKNKLIQLGVNEDQLISQGKGEFSSSRDCLTADCTYTRAKQRRTEFRLVENQPINSRVAKTEAPAPQIENILFAFDSVFFLQENANETIDKIASYLLQNTNANVTLTGHSDSVGPASYNMILSKNRANSIKDLLVQKGIDPGRIMTIGKGEEQLVNDCQEPNLCTVEQHRKNRRVEIVIFQ